MNQGRPQNTIEQFYAWIPPDNPDESVCTPWLGPRYGDGYGRFNNQLGMSRLAHRAIYEIRHGKITDGFLVLHRCDFRLCMRDNHHWRGTDADNMRDKAEKGRAAKGEKHPQAILTEIEVLAIRDLSSKGISNRIIADAFKIRTAQVCGIVTRRNWVHI